MPTSTSLTVVPGQTVLLFAAGNAPDTLLVKDGEDLTSRRDKLKVLDELYDRWVKSTYDETKSPSFKNGYLHGFLDGYTGSLFFVDDEDEPQINLVHVFEDHFDDEYSSEAGSYLRRPKKSGAEAARDYRRDRFEGKGGMKEYLESLGVENCRVWHVRYKNGRTYP